MLHKIFTHLATHQNPKVLEFIFFIFQILFIVLLIFLFKKKTTDPLSSQFRITEAERQKTLHHPIHAEQEPHEILGISQDASPKEIQKAYWKLMKHYHPDRIGTPGSIQWQEAQKIAKLINTAKEKLLKKNSHHDT